MHKLTTLMMGAVAALAANSANAAVCVGTCGVLGPDGVVTSSPLGGTYQYVSTAGGVVGAGSLAVGGETNGSLYTTSAFSAEAGDSLVFYFNFVTSDGGSFTDYAYSQLNGPTGDVIFTARTTPSGDTVPGFGLPGLSSVLVPSMTPIIPGAPEWSALGTGSTNTCFAAGCGYTGWIKSTYTITTAGIYTLSFGVTNINDTSYDTGLAFDGITVAGMPVGVPEPASWALMITGFGLVGGALRRRADRTAIA